MPSRRSVLTTGIIGILGITAGCLGRLQKSPREVKLTGIILRNVDDTGHVLELQLSHDGKKIINKKYDLSPQNISDGESGHVVAVEPVWGANIGEFTAKVRLDGDGQWSNLQLGNDVSGEYKYEIRVTEHGNIEGWHEASN